MHNDVSTSYLKTRSEGSGATLVRTHARQYLSVISIIGAMVFLVSVFALGVQRGEARTVRVSVPAASISVTAFFVARDRGFYKQEGLDVQLIQMPGGIAIQALVAGGLDFSTVVAGGLSAAIRGAPLINIYNTFYRPMWWIYANPDIRDVAGLKGKKVAVSGLADSSYIMLQEILKKNGLQGGGRDVVTIVMGDSPSRFNALVSGTIDATPVTLPYNFRAEEANFRQLVSFIKEDLVLLAGGIAVQENFYNTEPELVRAFPARHLEGFYLHGGESCGNRSGIGEEYQDSGSARSENLRPRPNGDDTGRKLERRCAEKGGRAGGQVARRERGAVPQKAF